MLEPDIAIQYLGRPTTDLTTRDVVGLVKLDDSIGPAYGKTVEGESSPEGTVHVSH